MMTTNRFASRRILVFHSILWMALVFSIGGISRAADRFARLPDPTRAEYPSHSLSVEKKKAKTWILQSTLISGERRVAIVNGRTVAIGDHLGSAKITDIQDNEIVLRRGQRTFRLHVVNANSIKTFVKAKDDGDGESD